MRTLTLACLLVGFSVAVADEPFTQKPAVAPSVVRGETPKEQPKAVASAAVDWDDLFSGGPKPLWLWGADQNKKYYLRTRFLMYSK